MIPDRGASRQADGARAAAIPGHAVFGPDGRRIVQARRQGRLACALLARRPALAFLPWRSRVVQRRIQPQTRHHRHGLRQPLTGRQQFQRRIGAVGDHDQQAFGQPGAHLDNHLARPIGELFVTLPAFLMVALRRRQHRQERQRPHPLRPRDGRQQHHAHPAKPTGLDEKRFARPHRIAVDAPGRNLRPTPPFDVVVDAEHHRAHRPARKPPPAGAAAHH